MPPTATATTAPTATATATAVAVTQAFATPLVVPEVEEGGANTVLIIGLVLVLGIAGAAAAFVFTRRYGLGGVGE